MAEISHEAKIVVATWWSIMELTELSFNRPHIINPIIRKGLDELVEKGYLTVSKFNHTSDRLDWRPTEKMKEIKVKDAMSFLKKNSIPITIEDEVENGSISS